MAKRTQHVVKHDDGWAVRGSNTDRVTKIFSTQSDAISFARDIAINQNTELFIHRRNGRIRARNSYGNDPSDIEG